MRKKNAELKNKIWGMKLNEAADAVIWVLEEHDKRFPSKTLAKDLLLGRIPEAICCMRRNAKGIRYIPTVENKEVGIASQSFVRRNWTEICLRCAEFGYFILWNPPGESHGLRLGTLEEYERQQSVVMGITTGMAMYHNQRSSVIKKHGDNCIDLHVKTEPHQVEDMA